MTKDNDVAYLRLDDAVAAVFAEGGPLAEVFEGYRPRPGQVEMALAVARSISDGGALVAEAPTGTGKSFAYGVPAILHVLRDRARYAREVEANRVAGEYDPTEGVRPASRVVICTSNISLQEQLLAKDLPLLEGLLGSVGTAVVKGMGNYLCLDRLDVGADEMRHLHQQFATSPEFRDEYDRIVAWSGRTRTGDKSDLEPAPASQAWRHFTTTSDDCKGKKGCKYAKDCHVLRSRGHAKQCGVVVTNYNLLCLDLAYGKPVIGDYDIVICDEAHRLPDIARATYGARITLGMIDRIAKLVSDDNRPLANALASLGKSYFDDLEHHADSKHYDGVRILHRGISRSAKPLASELAMAAELLAQRAEDVKSVVGPDKDPREINAQARKYARASYKADELQQLVLYCDKLRPSHVYSIERNPRSKTSILESSMLDVDQLLERLMFQNRTIRTTVLTSATMAAGGQLRFLTRQVGCRDFDGLIVQTPFDYSKQAMLVVPESMPDPKDDAYDEQLVAHVVRCADIAPGKILALFTSRSRMLDAKDGLVKAGHVAAAQGDASVQALVERFKAEDSLKVLCGTMSFWEGVDIPGLDTVIIDRIPFPMLSDPVHRTLGERDFGFSDYTLPRAAITLKQGFGRLIRRTTDHGAVVLLDRRLRTKKYGRFLLESLPDVHVSRDVEDLRILYARREAKTS